MRISRAKKAELNLDMAPLIDVVFLLLIFYMLTSSFVRDEGIQLELPSASTAQAMDQDNFTVSVSGEGDVFVDSDKVTLSELSELVSSRFSAASKDKSVSVRASSKASVESLVGVMDAVRNGGVEAVSIETNPEAE
ncbi:MAG: biopolymer transporter ExbD [Bdellovibrionales bacterium]|nr:biopolymer transporter ExbD [Bdellovibrionales bacterium]